MDFNGVCKTIAEKLAKDPSARGRVFGTRKIFHEKRLCNDKKFSIVVTMFDLVRHMKINVEAHQNSDREALSDSFSADFYSGLEPFQLPFAFKHPFETWIGSLKSLIEKPVFDSILMNS